MFVNLYGPTEITCNCTCYIVDREFGENEKLPIGPAFENEEVFLLNEKDQPVSPGEEGEICVRGTCLALGYYNDPERTNAVFVQNPLNDKYPELICGISRKKQMILAVAGALDKIYRYSI